MKKVIALALTLAMVLAMGVTAFASIAVPETFYINEKAVVEFSVSAEKISDLKVKDLNGFMTFGTILKLTGTDEYAVEVTGTKLGITEIIVTNKDVVVDTKVVNIVEREAEDPIADLTVAGVTEVSGQGSSIVTINVEGKDGFSGAAYNEATKYHPEAIVVDGDGFTVTLYRGDYRTTKMKDTAKVIITAEAADRIYDAKGNDMNNRVLAALGNNKADPFYVTVKSFNLDAVADKPEFEVELATLFGDNYYSWVLTNNSKAMAMYSFDATDDTVAVVAKSIKVNNSFDNMLTMPTTAAGTYVFVDATNAASSSANVKDNVSTGANDMMAVAVVFATIALAAGVSKKVR
jgi:hypothetical protein